MDISTTTHEWASLNEDAQKISVRYKKIRKSRSSDKKSHSDAIAAAFTITLHFNSIRSLLQTLSLRLLR